MLPLMVVPLRRHRAGGRPSPALIFASSNYSTTKLSRRKSNGRHGTENVTIVASNSRALITGARATGSLAVDDLRIRPVSALSRMDILPGSFISELPTQSALRRMLRPLPNRQLSLLACSRYSDVEQWCGMANRRRLSRLV